MLKKILYLGIVCVVLTFNIACSNDEVTSMENPEERIDILERKEVSNKAVYKAKVEKPRSPIFISDEQLADTINPQAIFHITENEDGTFSTELLEINISSSEEIQVEFPTKYSTVKEIKNTFSQIVFIKNNKIPYNTAFVVYFNVISPNDIDIQLKY